VEGWDNVLRAAATAFSERGLRRSAHEAGRAILVTGSSDIGLSGPQLEAAEKLAGGSFGRIVLASHSGGFVGLEETLRSPSFPKKRIRQVLMLDNMYSSGMREPLRRLTSAGADCSGFYTRQSDRYWSIVQGYLGVCRLEDRTASGDHAHSQSVNACLSRYAAGASCADDAPQEMAQR
jgi:hypothetical protein